MNNINNISTITSHDLDAIFGLNTTEVLLKPLEGQQKSFYKKAVVVFNSDNDNATLYSYNTPILRYNFITREYRRLWGGWTVTTAQHIKAFVGRYITKAEWLGLGVGLPVFTQQGLEGGDLNKTRRQLA